MRTLLEGGSLGVDKESRRCLQFTQCLLTIRLHRCQCSSIRQQVCSAHVDVGGIKLLDAIFLKDVQVLLSLLLGEL